MLHQIALQMICNLSYRHFDLVRSPGNVFVLVVAVLLVLCEANDDNRKCRIISAFETWLQTSYWTIQRWCFVPWLYMSFISTDSLFTIACSIVAVRARLNTTPCWRRPVFITTTETTSSWELAVVNSSVWRHWALPIQVHIPGQLNCVQVISVHSVSSRDSQVCIFTHRWEGDVTRFKSIPNLMPCNVPNLSN